MTKQGKQAILHSKRLTTVGMKWNADADTSPNIVNYHTVWRIFAIDFFARCPFRRFLGVAHLRPREKRQGCIVAYTARPVPTPLLFQRSGLKMQRRLVGA